ncbi:MAG: DUF4430 domain-containing protein [Ruminococcaceae bacterium]|nr:DUF4430 domain-containing protein [Oscillospiraceae bacterium]
MKRLVAILLCLCLFAPVAYGADTQTLVDSELAPLAGQSAEWFIFAIARTSPETDFSVYRESLLNYVDENDPDQMASLRIALALVFIGDGQNEFCVRALESVEENKSVMSLVFGLHLINNGITAENVTGEDIVSCLLGLQSADGGWSLTGERGDADVTAMVLAALAENRDMPGVETAISAGLEFLSGAQLPSGGFMSYGVENAESSAQVIIALDALGIDPGSDGRFVKNGVSVRDALEVYRLSSGGYSHVPGGAESRIATAQSMCALGAIETEGSFWVTDKAPVEYAPVRGESGLFSGYKLWACIGIATVGVAACAVVLAKGYSKKNLALVGLVCAVGICGVLFTDIRSKDGYFGMDDPSGEAVGTVTLEIRCDTVAGRAEHIPPDGILLEKTEIPLYSGDTAYDILTRGVREAGLLMENEGQNYISGIGNIYERDFGDLSGWLYYVNGESPSVGCGEYRLSPGDSVVFVYSLEMGKDIDLEN